MAITPEQLAASKIVDAVRSAFLEEADAVDEILLKDGYDEDAYFSWIEHFSQFTTDAIKRMDFDKASSHMSLFSRILSAGSEATIQCIDVAYVESLMWDIQDVNLKREGWKRMPSNLKRLYIATWGERPFMLCEK